MRSNQMIRPVAVLLLLMFMTLNAAGCAASTARAETLTGVVTDIHCFLKKPDVALDTRMCLQMEACANTGYGLVVKQADGTMEFMFLDGGFHPDASGAQKKVRELIDGSAKNDHFYFKVDGTVAKDKKTVAYDKSYSVIHVTDIVETDAP